MATETPAPETQPKKPRLKSVKMTNLVNTELMKTRGPSQEGAWNPLRHRGFSKSPEDIIRFFSGHPFRNHPDYRERYARWAIEEALREYLPDERFKLSGQVMQNETVTWEAGNRKMSKKMGEVIRAEGQNDIDAEDPNGPSDTGCEIIQGVSAVSQTLISSSPNSIGPPIQACVEYLRMEKCGEYGRNKLTVWKSPLFPQLDNKGGRKGLLDNQVTAIVWILSRFFGELPRLLFKDPQTRMLIDEPEKPSERENREKLRGPNYRGGILADSMGLGKTLTTIACLSLLAKRKLNVRRDKNSKLKYHYPMLIVTPNATVAQQWVDEIEEITKHSAIDTIIVTGNGLNRCKPKQPRAHALESTGFPIDKIIVTGNGPNRRKPKPSRVHALEPTEFHTGWPKRLDYVWDNQNPKAAKTMLVMSIDTWSSRTCKLRGDEGEQEWYSTFTDRGRQFSVVVVDEANKVKNPATRNWKSIALLKRQFTLLVTATPCMNTLTDLFGLVRLLWQTAEDCLKENEMSWSELEDTFKGFQDLTLLDDHKSWEIYQIAAGSPALLSRLIYKRWGSKDFDIQDIRKYLKYFESLAILKRSPTSYIFNDWGKTQPVPLEGLLPDVENYTVDIEPNDSLAQEYQEVHTTLLIGYLEAVREWSRKPKKNGVKAEKEALKSITGTLRHFQIASASLDVLRLDKVLSANNFGTKAEHVATMRNNGVSFFDLAQFLLEPKDAKLEVGLDYVKLAVRKSPILRYILHYIRENILNREENGSIKKLLITEASPILAYYYELVLQFLGFNCRAFHSNLSNDARKKLIDDFNSDNVRSCQILIQMYTVGFAGSNLHKSCSRVLIASQAHSFNVQSQTMHRVIRVGQKADVVTVHRLKVNNTFHAFRESRQIEKMLPEMSARAQGCMNDVLVQLLNLFQYEVDEAWESPEAQHLMATKSLLTEEASKDSDSDSTAEEPSKKRIKLEDGTAKGVDDAHTPTAVKDVKLSKSLLANTKFLKKPKSPQTGDGSAGWFADRNLDSDDENDQNDAFLRRRPREAYYAEFKSLPDEARSQFSHTKNDLRRQLSFRNHERWTVADLDDAAVLERAMELMLRVRLGSRTSAMLPLPLQQQADTQLSSEAQRRRMRRLLADVKHTDQDVERARAGTDSTSRSRGSKDNVGAIKSAIGGVGGERKTYAEIDEALRREIRYGGAEAAAKSARKLSVCKPEDEGTRVNLRDIVMFPGRGGGGGEEDDECHDDEAAEGEASTIGDKDDDDDDDEIKIMKVSESSSVRLGPVPEREPSVKLEKSPVLGITNWKQRGDIGDPVDLTDASPYDVEKSKTPLLKKPKVEDDADDVEDRGCMGVSKTKVSSDVFRDVLATGDFIDDDEAI
ncbi:P-loop containing nucleoside triphosphate hydrolase protein [Xylariaceae sp. FL0662B]|nr:P-loop containing nucleoside triphosphate hydrolase protein [Xylariaceae sp. FL0662B]